VTGFHVTWDKRYDWNLKGTESLHAKSSIADNTVSAVTTGIGLQTE